jgi:hypothetical protein
MQLLALAMAFIIELVVFVSFAALGTLAPGTDVQRWVLFGVLLAGVVTFWGMYMAPKAPRKLRGKAYYGTKAAVYICAAIAIGLIQGVVWAGGFIAVFLIDEAILYKPKA